MHPHGKEAAAVPQTALAAEVEHPSGHAPPRGQEPDAPTPKNTGRMQKTLPPKDRRPRSGKNTRNTSARPPGPNTRDLPRTTDLIRSRMRGLFGTHFTRISNRSHPDICRKHPAPHRTHNPCRCTLQRCDIRRPGTLFRSFSTQTRSFSTTERPVRVKIRRSFPAAGTPPPPPREKQIRHPKALPEKGRRPKNKFSPERDTYTEYLLYLPIET